METPLLWWQALLAVAAGLVVVYLLGLAVLWKVKPPEATLGDALRLLPDLLRLVTSLARDRDVPRRVRVLLTLLLVYLASPIDLIPDFIPVLGYADDAIVVAVALRAVVRGAGAEKIRQHWAGSPAGLTLVNRLAGLPSAGPPGDDQDT